MERVIIDRNSFLLPLVLSLKINVDMDLVQLDSAGDFGIFRGVLEM